MCNIAAGQLVFYFTELVALALDVTPFLCVTPVALLYCVVLPIIPACRGFLDQVSDAVDNPAIRRTASYDRRPGGSCLLSNFRPSRNLSMGVFLLTMSTLTILSVMALVVSHYNRFSSFIWSYFSALAAHFAVRRFSIHSSSFFPCGHPVFGYLIGTNKSNFTVSSPYSPGSASLPN